MKIAHLLRKYVASEWGGTETALLRLVRGLRERNVESVLFAPCSETATVPDPIADAGFVIRRFNAFLPYWGLTEAQRHQMTAVGGNLLSFDVMGALWREPAVDIIHTHTMGRLGGIALTLARIRHIPMIVTIHGGLYDLPEDTLQHMIESSKVGWQWGRVFGWLLQARKVVAKADAIITLNPREAKQILARFPTQRVLTLPHGIPLSDYTEDHSVVIQKSYPQLYGKKIVLVTGRIDAVKNQRWLVEQWPYILQRHPDVFLVLAGAITDPQYGEELKRCIQKRGVENTVLLTGGLPPSDPRLVGLQQQASIIVVPSVSETFGIVILEAWAAKVAVLASRTSGALQLVHDGENGCLFDLSTPDSFHSAFEKLLNHPEQAKQMAMAGHQIVATQFDAANSVHKTYDLYQECIDSKKRLKNRCS